MVTGLRGRIGLLAAASAVCAVPAAAQVVPSPIATTPVPASAAVGDVVVNMHAVEIADVAEQISRITGRTLILDPNVRGTVNVTSAEPLTRNGVWELFQSVLRTQGFAAVRSGRAWRIIPQANAVRDVGSGRAAAADVATRLIRLRNVPAEQAARVFRPLINSFGTIEPLGNPNAIVVTDYRDNIARIERLAAQLDGGGGSSFEVIPLRYAAARDVAAAISGVMGDTGGVAGPRVVGDERSNSVVVRGAPNLVAEAQRLARTLDKRGTGTPVTRTFRLQQADAESVTEVLRGVLGQPTQATNAVTQTFGGRRGGLGASAFGTGATGTGNLGIGGGINGVGAVPPIGSAAGLGSLTGGTTTAATGALGAFGDTTGSGGTGNASTQPIQTPDLIVQPAPEINAIVVRGTPAAIATIEPIIADLDIRRPQVRIEAAIVEVNSDDADALGVQLGLGNAVPGSLAAATSSFSNIGAPISGILQALGATSIVGALTNGLSYAIADRNSFSLLVQALGTSTRANLLSTPSVTVLDNSPAEFVAGQNVPFRTGSFATSGNTLTPFTTIERQDVGITLRVLPRVHQGNVVRLEVALEVSSLVDGTVSGAADLITNRRALTTYALADDGVTQVLGGLITDDRSRTKGQVPLLGDVPVVGELFKSRRNSQSKRTLFVFLKPTILRDSAAASAATASAYGRLRGDEAGLYTSRSLLLDPPGPRLTVEINGIY